MNKIHRLGKVVAVGGGLVWYTHQAWRVQSELRRLGGFLSMSIECHSDDLASSMSKGHTL